MTTLWWRLLLASYCICWCGADMSPSKTIATKHFERVARVFKAAAQHATSADAEGMRLHIASHMCNLFKEANPNFDRTRFLLACGAAKRGVVTGAVMVSADAARTLQNL
jgi:tetrahydromethanopterin S-methyltransferase subunit A